MSVGDWFYRLDGKPHGPFKSAQFEKLIRGGAVTLDTEVSADGTTWHTLRETLAGLPSEVPVDDWDCPTLLPGEVRMPRLRRPERKPESSG